MAVISIRILYRFGRLGCFLAAVIFHLIVAACPASALDPASSFADYASTTWTHRDGLRSTFIRAIAQTADGYIWLGTTDGLFRFDGARFVQWHSKEPAPHGLGVVNVLGAARDGSLLVGT